VDGSRRVKCVYWRGAPAPHEEGSAVPIRSLTMSARDMVPASSSSGHFIVDCTRQIRREAREHQRGRALELTMIE
jgi:hypothetical protein